MIKTAAQEIISDIKNGEFTNAELNDIARAIQFARARLLQKVKRELEPGMTVYFKNRAGSRVIATVESIKIKNAIVNSNGHRYRVPCNMLEV